MKRKHPFILLEVLIALTLVILCAIPLVLAPIRAYRQEILVAQEVEGEKLADWTFSQIKEKLLNNEISWDQLPGLYATTGPFFLEPQSIYISDKKTQRIERSFELFGKGEKEGPNGEIYRMIYVKIRFRPNLLKKNVPFRVIVQRLPKKESPSSSEEI